MRARFGKHSRTARVVPRSGTTLVSGAHPRQKDRLVYLAFDLLYLDGCDLRGAPLIERKRALQRVLAKTPPKIHYVEFFEMHDGDAIYRHACKLGLEGIVSKRRDSPYRSGRQETWLKLKCTKSDTFAIVAFVEKLGARPRKIASLYVGRREGCCTVARSCNRPPLPPRSAEIRGSTPCKAILRSTVSCKGSRCPHHTRVTGGAICLLQRCNSRGCSFSRPQMRPGCAIDLQGPSCPGGRCSAETMPVARGWFRGCLRERSVPI
jgi:hypothetical protein